MKDKNDVFLIARIPKKLKEKLKERSKEQHVSISKVAREILTATLND